ncbi:TPA: hypothetical protein QIF36_002408 [Enterobacter kobei]|nr:hypothetical protein [Enterobacter kobei]
MKVFSDKALSNSTPNHWLASHFNAKNKTVVKIKNGEYHDYNTQPYTKAIKRTLYTLISGNKEIPGRYYIYSHAFYTSKIHDDNMSILVVLLIDKFLCFKRRELICIKSDTHPRVIDGRGVMYSHICIDGYFTKKTIILDDGVECICISKSNKYLFVMHRVVFSKDYEARTRFLLIEIKSKKVLFTINKHYYVISSLYFDDNDKPHVVTNEFDESYDFSGEVLSRVLT